MPDEEPIVWPEDPAETDSHSDETEPAGASAAAASDWPGTFDEALKQSRAMQEPAAAAPMAEEAVDEYPTQPSMPAIQAQTEPPEPARTEPSVAALGTPDEMPTSTFKTPVPGTVSSTNGEQPAEAEPAEPAAPVAETAEPEVTAEPEPEIAAVEAQPATAAEDEPDEVGEPAEEKAAEPEPVQAAEPGPEPEAEPEPAEAPAPEAEPAKEPDGEPEPVRAAEPEPAPATATKEDEWVPMPENPPMPSWAPRFGVAIQHPIAAKPDAPVPSVPGWAPSTSSMPAAPRQGTSPGMPVPGSKPPQPAAPAPSFPPAPAPAAGGSRPPEPAKSKTSSSWEIVQPKDEHPKQAYVGPTAEDKSYAEWFAWAKRSGAPAGACHAAAQGAFRALAAGHDMNTAVQWATLAMAQPPGLVSASRQLYCAWYSLGNIDLRLPTPQAHAFATGAIAALEGGADAPTAHQAGLAAAGITA